MLFKGRRLVWWMPCALLITLGLSIRASGAEPAVPAHDGASIYQQRCASCHENPGPASRAPARAAIAGRGPDAVFNALSSGAMKPMAEGLSPADLDAVALYLTGSAPSHGAVAASDPDQAARCQSTAAPTLAGPSWNGWSPALDNARYAATPGIAASDVPRLRVKWAFAFAGGLAGQPTVVGDRLYLGTGGGRIYALDAKSGCIHWRSEFEGGIRAALTVGPLSGPQGPAGKLAVFAGDRASKVHAFDAATGQELWSVKLDDHQFATITGSPVLYGGRLYVPLSSTEEIGPLVPNYRCCHFRGQVVALDPATGKELWRTYTIVEEPRAYRNAPDGTPVFGPAGAAIWSAPTIDPKRGLLYVATGDSYTDAPAPGADAVFAMDLVSGKVAWQHQITANDNFLVGCTGKPDQPSSCPLEVGPDHDFGASPILRELPGGRTVLLLGQKSGEVTAIDPDRQGAVIWRNRLSPGGSLGGIEWGMAADDTRVFAPIADAGVPKEEAKPGLYALAIADGKLTWAAPAPEPDCAVAPKGSLAGICTGGLSASATAIPGAVFASSLDGIMRAYDSGSGAVLWSLDVGQTEFQPVNTASPVKGSTINQTGATVAGGTVYQISGYTNAYAPGGATPPSLLLALTVDGR